VGTVKNFLTGLIAVIVGAWTILGAVTLLYYASSTDDENGFSVVPWGLWQWVYIVPELGLVGAIVFVLIYALGAKIRDDL
jgi:hypothetical protein